jgi:hypothetical protein
MKIQTIMTKFPKIIDVNIHQYQMEEHKKEEQELKN